MASKLGIIAAAGKAVRFGGALKELLPCDVNGSLLWRHSNVILRGMDQVIITNQDKIGVHARHIVTRCQPLLQHYQQDIWGAIRTGIQFPADEYYFVMADTYIPFVPALQNDLTLGAFYTDMPERFGMIRDAGIVNKEAGEPGMAWGCFSFSNDVADYWRQEKFKSYTHALNMAMVYFGYDVEEMPYYYDMATFEDYREFLCQESL